MNTTSNKRIAKNTIFLYIRMGLIMLVSLYTSRVVLAQLGIDDYGVYVVVGGVVSMFSFLNSSMTTATQRYLNYELGHPDSNIQKIRSVFSTSLTIHLVIALLVILAGETIGLWFVNNKLVIPESSIVAANIVYQCAIFSFCITIFQVPFNAAIIAHEEMHLFAIVSILEAVFKLLIAYALILATNNKLAVYGILLLVVHFIIALIYGIVCLRRFKECTLKLIYIPSKFKEMSKFAGWNMFGSIAWIARNQGMGIVLNLFFGPALNAAKGISDQVSNAVNTLSNNFQIALNPQITKNYAGNNLKDMEILTYRGIKFSSFLIWLMALPIMLNASVILHIWLEDVPGYASLFTILILFDCISGNLFGTPLMTSLAATGNIKAYQITVSCVLLLILPAAYIALNMGFPPETIFYLNIIFNFLSGITRFVFCKRQIAYSFRFYLRYAFTPVILLMFMSGAITLTCKKLFEYWDVEKYIQLIALCAISIVTVSVLAWYVGFNKDERKTLESMILTKLKHRGENM